MFEARSGSLYAVDTFNPKRVGLSDAASEPQEGERKRPRVLVVDDEKLIVDTVSEILESAGFHVLAAYDGLTALQAAARFRPDYLLSDVLMPRMNGVELALAVRKLHPAARILLFSGHAGISELLHEARQQGLEYELIAKPLHPLKLIEQLKGHQS